MLYDGLQVLYVSDHIYADLNMSKKWVGWRTMLVVPELQTELILQTKFSHVQVCHTASLWLQRLIVCPGGPSEAANKMNALLLMET